MPGEEQRIVFVGRLERDATELSLRNQFSEFGHIIEVQVHHLNNAHFGFVTYQRARDALSAVEAANTFPQYDIWFGGRRNFHRQRVNLDRVEVPRRVFHG